MDTHESKPTPTYTCDECGGIFKYGWSDDEAHKESLEQFGVTGDAPGMAIVCDDCYKTIMASVRN